MTNADFLESAFVASVHLHERATDAEEFPNGTPERRPSKVIPTRLGDEYRT